MVLPRKSQAGALTGYDGLITNIPERKLAEEQRTSANAELAANQVALKRTLEELQAAETNPVGVDPGGQARVRRRAGGGRGARGQKPAADPAGWPGKKASQRLEPLS